MKLTEATAEQAIADLKKAYIQEQQEIMITQKQVSYIRFLWLSVDYSECEQGDRLLSNFLRNKYGVQKPEQLTKQQAFGCISAIKRMQKNAEANKGEITVSNHISVDPASGNQVAWVILPDGKRMACHLTDKNIQ